MGLLCFSLATEDFYKRFNPYILELMQRKFNRSALIILDGWGHGKFPEASAIAQAKTPFVDSLYRNYPNAELITFGPEVGLPLGQMGNSEVGHLNMGAGRVVDQELARINKAIREKTLDNHAVLLEALAHAKASDKKVHLLGLISDGGVHAHIHHLKAICAICEAQELKRVYIHAFTDGRDTDPRSGVEYMTDLQADIQNQAVEIASVIGRYYAMDRDQRWERTRLAYDLLVHGKGMAIKDPKTAIQAAYTRGLTDEFLLPMVCVDERGEARAKIEEGDVVICYNFRKDRCRQLTRALQQEAFPDYGMQPLSLHYYTLTRYDETFEGVRVLFEKDDIQATLGEVLANAGKTQVRMAETEKYPHVSFFFSGGREASFEGEKRIIVPSPKVATYDLQPEMSAYELTEKMITELKDHRADFICLNYANTDMVGHTGVFEAAVKAAETVDTCLKNLVPVLLEKDYAIIITADHGNSDYMVNQDGSPNTAHTTNLVPCFLLGKNLGNTRLKNGKLGDIAPTLLHLMQIKIPDLMTGEVLIEVEEQKQVFKKQD